MNDEDDNKVILSVTWTIVVSFYSALHFGLVTFWQHMILEIHMIN